MTVSIKINGFSNNEKVQAKKLNSKTDCIYYEKKAEMS